MNMEETTFYGLGRRKTATAQVVIKLGSGNLTINDINGQQYLQNNLSYLQKIQRPLELVGVETSYDILVKTNGGGLTGQTDAITLAVARALIKLNLNNRTILKSNGLLTRDSRIKERKNTV
uniref:Ribosomal protein S9 n=1 Tax=Rhizochromulina marina TaxID=1034831 RepID=A0A514CPT3_9STRA|nr:ribosomal protein S9 [Rhizochromulina marina]QDH81819.1 ribosomal protein S9 [Rhizochromulina marina]